MKLTVTTPAGVFTRTTDTLYRYVNVWDSPRARRLAASPYRQSGVYARWVQDRGYAVTWHSSEQAAAGAARRGYGWDSAATLIGTFPVDSKEYFVLKRTPKE